MTFKLLYWKVKSFCLGSSQQHFSSFPENFLRCINTFEPIRFDQICKFAELQLCKTPNFLNKNRQDKTNLWLCSYVVLREWGNKQEGSSSKLGFLFSVLLLTDLIRYDEYGTLLIPVGKFLLVWEFLKCYL